MFRHTHLTNGLTVASAEMPHMASVSLGLWVGVGSRYEPAELNGASHLIEHMLFKGTRRRSARQISQEVEGLGGYLNAFTSEEITCFHAKAGREHLRELLDVLMDMVLGSRFDPQELEKEREVIKEEMAMYLDEPQHQVQELFNATLWPDHPLGRPITGTNQVLDRISRDALLGFFRRNYVSRRTLVVAAGNVGHRALLRAVQPYARRLGAGPGTTFAPAWSGQRKPAVKLFKKKTEQTQIALGFRACSRHDPRRFALRLLNTIVGENMSSRLFQVLREDRGLVYSVYSTPSFFEDAGDFVIYAGMDTDHLPRSLDLILAELRRLKETPVKPGELRRARDYVMGQLDLSLESTEHRMNWIGEQLLGYGRVHRPAYFKRCLAQVTPREIQAVARDFFQADRLNVALVSPLRSDRPLRARLRL